MSLFPEIDKYNKSFEIAFQIYIKKIKKNNPTLSSSISDLYEFEDLNCTNCSKYDNCQNIAFLAMNGEHENILLVEDKALCLDKDGVLNQLRYEFISIFRKRKEK